MSDYDAQWRKIRARMLRDAQWCALCGGPLDLAAAPRSPLAPSVDHVVSLRSMRGMDADTRERLRLDPAALRVVHFGCNSRRGDGRRDRPKHISRKWD